MKARLLTEGEKERVRSALEAEGFTDIEWKGDQVWCSHESHGGAKPKGIITLIRRLGFDVPCGGIAGKAYCQVHPK
jgi:hypothetical protein